MSSSKSVASTSLRPNKSPRLLDARRARNSPALSSVKISTAKRVSLDEHHMNQPQSSSPVSMLPYRAFSAGSSAADTTSPPMQHSLMYRSESAISTRFVKLSSYCMLDLEQGAFAS